jgi:hypothetical protein
MQSSPSKKEEEKIYTFVFPFMLESLMVEQVVYKVNSNLHRTPAALASQ